MNLPFPPEDDSPRDVLAAEEFVLPAPDPRLHVEPAHDVLAAEEFPLPAPDPGAGAGHRPIPLPPDPDDPAGTEPPHDVLAAEEFAVPGTLPHSLPPGYAPVSGEPGLRDYLTRVGAILLTGGLLFTLVRRRARRRLR